MLLQFAHLKTNFMGVPVSEGAASIEILDYGGDYYGMWPNKEEFKKATPSHEMLNKFRRGRARLTVKRYDH